MLYLMLGRGGRFIPKMKKYSMDQLTGRLGNGGYISFYLNDEDLETEICIWRSDLSEPKKYDKETYILTIKKYKTGYYPEDTVLFVDIRKEFPSVNEVLDYLEEEGITKRDDIIKSD